MVRHLIKQGYEVNVSDNFGCTPLHYSSMLNVLHCSNGDCVSKNCTEINANMGIMDVLLQSGANVNQPDRGWGTPLYIAVMTGNPQVVRNLLYNECFNGGLAIELDDISVKNSDSNTPLHLAVEMGNQEIVELLLAKGANADASNKNGESPFGIAIRKGNMDIINKLKPYIDINFRNSFNEETYLHYAVAEKNSYVVSYLLRRGVDINAQNIYNETPLHYSVKRMDTGITEMLLGDGANVFAENVYRKTPLYYAMKAKNMEFFRLLLQKNSNHQYAIHFAVIWQNIDLIKNLVNGGDVNLKFKDDGIICNSEKD
ncbi:Ankyrin repeats (3 copies) [Popillia japonica]|uniref:Ankyrin repeats (3 copies) n=1 Tax=Popillia japonica TaxID=7064 RepID=A0AAW1IYQ8_POPJA